MFGVREQNYFLPDLLTDKQHNAESNFFALTQQVWQFSRSRDIVGGFRAPFSPSWLIDDCQMSAKD